MPTGYTHSILEGQVKSLPEFAKLCARAFGATIHMRDEPLDAPFEMQHPSDYHLKEIAKQERILAKLDATSDDVIVVNKQNLLAGTIERYKSQIRKCGENYQKLSSMLAEAENWDPPTDDHNGLKSFMIEQIKTTIRHDCDATFYWSALKDARGSMKKINALDVRNKIRDEAKKNLAYHKAEYESERIRCEKANLWVLQLIESFN